MHDAAAGTPVASTVSPSTTATHRSTVPAPTTTRHTTSTTTRPPSPRTEACSIRSNAGNCYQAGQFCRKSDLGKSTTDAQGRRITCGIESGKPHWHY